MLIEVAALRMTDPGTGMIVVDLHGPWIAARRAPMLRVALPFVAGLLMAWRFLPTVPQASYWLLAMTPLVIVVMALPALRVSRWQRGLLLFLWFFSFGLFWQVVRLPESDPRHVSHAREMSATWLVRVDAINGITPKLLRADASLIARATGLGVAAPVHGKVMLSMMRSLESDPLRVGDRLILRATVEPIARIADPGGFDRQGWAASRGITWEAFVGAGDRIYLDHPYQWTDVFAAARERVGKWLKESGLPVRERALVKALILGERDELDGEQKNAFARSGTIHVLAVSGMHVGLIFMALSSITGWWGQHARARWARALVLLLALWCYAGLTGASPSVLRATVMFSIFILAGLVRMRTEHFNSLCGAAIALLLWDPAMLHHVGFQLSFLAVLGIVLFLRPLQALWSPSNGLLRQVWSLAAISLSAQAFTTPLSLFAFKAFPVWFLPANIVVVAAAGFAVYGGVALIALHKLPYVGEALAWGLEQLLRFVGWSTGVFASLPGAYPAVRASFADMVLLFALVSALGAWWLWRWGSMRWATGMVLALLLCSWGLSAHDSHERAAFVVYDERDGVLAAMLHGRTLDVMSTTDSMLTSERALLKIDRHRRALGIDAVHAQALISSRSDTVHRTGSSCFGYGRWRSHRYDVLFSTGESPAQVRSADRFDAIVLHDTGYLDEAQLDRLLASTQRLVLAGGVPWRARRLARERCNARGLYCHDIGAQGAFILER
ncbi:MAG: ComEC/Rec2 family competence protein [Flavobacteriales bacterium]|nr:ComEC/Rec2 family competence protein [Flavobacteriales bacterium]